jgi:hypothetical protein
VPDLHPEESADCEEKDSAPTHVDLLILGPDIVTFDDADSVIAGGAIAVRGN